MSPGGEGGGDVQLTPEHCCEQSCLRFYFQKDDWGLLQMVKSLAPFPFLFNLNIKSLKKHAFYFNEIPPHENVNCYFLDRTANHRQVPSFHLRGKPLLPKRVGQSPPQSENQGRHSCSWRWSRTPPETPTSLTSGWILLEAENGLIEIHTNPQIWEF